MADILELKNHFLAILTEIQKKRPEFRGQYMDIVTVNGRKQGIAKFVVYEVEQMHSAINNKRIEIGLETIDIDHVYKADSLASGHYDYSSKLSLYCALITTTGDQWLLSQL
jgi:hypothetical protein